MKPNKKSILKRKGEGIMKHRIYKAILKFEHWRLSKKKIKLQKELNETNQGLLDLEKVL